MKDDKRKKLTPAEMADAGWLSHEEAEAMPVPAPEPAAEAALPTGTHADNLKKTRRAGKP